MRYTTFEKLDEGETFSRGFGSSLVFEKVGEDVGRTLLNNSRREFAPGQVVLAKVSRCTVALDEDESCGRRAVESWREFGETFGQCAAHRELSRLAG